MVFVPSVAGVDCVGFYPSCCNLISPRFCRVFFTPSFYVLCPPCLFPWDRYCGITALVIPSLTLRTCHLGILVLIPPFWSSYVAPFLPSGSLRPLDCSGVCPTRDFGWLLAISLKPELHRHLIDYANPPSPWIRPPFMTFCCPIFHQVFFPFDIASNHPSLPSAFMPLFVFSPPCFGPSPFPVPSITWYFVNYPFGKFPSKVFLVP